MPSNKPMRSTGSNLMTHKTRYSLLVEIGPKVCRYIVWHNSNMSVLANESS